MMDMKTWLGIDFSGDHLRWRKDCKRSNVWLATVKEREGQRKLVALQQVQNLPEEYGEHPFDRLVNFLRTGNFDAGGIDAPFSVPAQFVPQANYFQLLKKVNSLPHPARPFPKGINLVKALAQKIPERKSDDLFRETEKFWKAKGLNLRPSLWTKGRAGAPMTSACLKLLSQSGCPIWPWAMADRPGLVVEAFPAGQLKQWNLPHQKYGGANIEAKKLRRKILRFLKKKIEIADFFQRRMLESADALDAVICAFAAIAVTEDKLAVEPEREFSDLEGWISVHG